jgi:hypothetical protein
MKKTAYAYIVVSLLTTGCGSSGGQVIKPVTPTAQTLNDEQIRTT